MILGVLDPQKQVSFLSFGVSSTLQNPWGTGTGPALTGMIDQERDSKVGCGLEAVSRWCTLVHPEENDVRKSVPRQPRAILRICYSSYVK